MTIEPFCPSEHGSKMNAVCRSNAAVTAKHILLIAKSRARRNPSITHPGRSKTCSAANYPRLIPEAQASATPIQGQLHFQQSKSPHINALPV